MLFSEIRCIHCWNYRYEYAVWKNAYYRNK